MTKFLTLCLLFAFFSCQSESRKTAKEVDLITPKGKTVRTRLAVTMKDQEQGLSGVQSGDFDDDQGMLFYYLEDGDKYFWMPDTYFDLDLFYLDKDLRVLDIVRKLPHHIGRHNESLIPRARGVWCRHVLEMKSTSPIAGEIKVGDQLTWKAGIPLSEMDAKAKEMLKQ
jgi:uncharacterized membrane protein (UPF0127 family)